MIFQARLNKLSQSFMQHLSAIVQPIVQHAQTIAVSSGIGVLAYALFSAASAPPLVQPVKTWPGSKIFASLKQNFGDTINIVKRTDGEHSTHIYFDDGKLNFAVPEFTSELNRSANLEFCSRVAAAYRQNGYVYDDSVAMQFRDDAITGSHNKKNLMEGQIYPKLRLAISHKDLPEPNLKRAVSKVAAPAAVRVPSALPSILPVTNFSGEAILSAKPVPANQPAMNAKMRRAAQRRANAQALGIKIPETGTNSLQKLSRNQAAAWKSEFGL